MGNRTAVLVLGLLLLPALLLASEARPLQAVRVNPVPPRIDGVLDDSAWQSAPRFAGFTQRDPHEGQPATEETEVRLVYDDEALYVGIVAYDREPEKVAARLVRRDQWTEADRLLVILDAHHDHQTACWFEINAAGSLKDGIISNDGDGWGSWDDTWNGVWEARQSRGATGWCAEFRIPYHALRFSPREEYTWGINLVRYISRRKEESFWVMVPHKESGFVSRFAHLEGIRQIAPARSLEALPYSVGRSTLGPQGEPHHRDLFANLGVDVRYGLSSSTSLNATINPDFGQVDADPARLNLSVFEDFQEERRPFFVEGAQTFQTPIQLFYSRRIGKRPGHFSVPDGYEVADQPEFTTISGAAKVTGKTEHQTTFGVLEAVTADEYATLDSAEALAGAREMLLEPRTHFLVGRVKQDLFKGNSHVGLIATALNRRRSGDAYSGGVDWNLKWRNSGYEFWGQAALSQAAAEDGRQRGVGNQMVLGKRNGWLRGELWWEAISRGFEINDLGFQWRNNYYQSWIWVQFRREKPWRFFRRNFLNINRWGMRNFDGATLENGFNLNTWHQFANYWWIGGEFSHQFRALDDLDTRGGPLIVRPSRSEVEFSVESDDRRMVSGFFELEWGHGSAGSTHRQVSSGLTLRPGSSLELRVRPRYQRDFSHAQWLENEDGDGDGAGDRFVYGELKSQTLDLTSRANFIFSRDLSLEIYLQPFISSGDYGHFKELARPRSYEFIPHPGPQDNPDFSQRSLHSNAVLRWEYRPGSTLYVVWSQSRERAGERPRFRPLQDLGSSWVDEGANVFLIKMNYWLNL